MSSISHPDSNRQPTIRRAKHGKDNPYFMMLRATAQDRSLSYEARGMLAYILSRPNNWHVQVSDLILQPDDKPTMAGKAKVYSILDELAVARYIVKPKRLQDDKGKYVWTPYEVYEHPYTDLPDMGEPYTGKPDVLHSTEEQKREGEITPPPQEQEPPTPADVDAAIYDAPRTVRAPQQFPDYGPRAQQIPALKAERSMQTTHPLYDAYAAQFETPPPRPARVDMAAAWWAEDYGYAPAHVAKATAQRLKSGRGGTAFKFIIQDLHTLLAGSGPLLQLVAAEAPAPVEAPAPAPRMSRAEVDALLNGAVDPEAKSA